MSSYRCPTCDYESSYLGLRRHRFEYPKHKRGVKIAKPNLEERALEVAKANSLVRSAALAQEMFGDDELERFASEETRRRGL